jgi:type IV secretory pathway VirD2 relaxase
MCGLTAVSDEREFRVRPGRIRSSKAQRARPFIAQALAAAQRAGGRLSYSGNISPGNRSRFGRGKRATVQANRLLTSRSRIMVIKTRVVRHSRRSAPMSAHLSYLRREGVTRDGEKARLFGPGGDDLDAKEFAERCEDDRHHFRFIVSPEDAVEMVDLKAFTRELMSQMEKDLGTRLDWVAIDHWNTDNPHVHVILRGRTDDGQDLVISRDYIKEGIRARAQDLVTMELGQRSDHEMHRNLARQVEAEHWTSLDRQLLRDAHKSGIIDLAPPGDRQLDEFHAFKVGRLHTLESLGLAHQIGAGQWYITEEAEPTLRELGERGDIIKRLHRALTERGIERGAASFVLAGESLGDPVIGRLVDRGLDDELSGTAYAVIDGVDGRAHHIRLSDLDAAGDSTPGSIVELRRFTDTRGRQRVAIAVRSDLPIERQVTASGATWLDRQAISRDPIALSDGGFGREVQDALERRAEHLVEEGLAQRQGGRMVFARRLLDTLRRREVEALGEKLATDLGRPFNKAATGDYVAGTYSQRITLASGRFAMIDDGLGFQLVPWTPSLDRKLGQHISGIARGDAGVDWSYSRKRGIGL